MANKSKKKKNTNLKKGEIIEIVNLIRNMNYKATKKQTKRLVEKKAVTVNLNF